MRIILRDCNNQFMGAYTSWRGAKIAASKLENRLISIYQKEEERINDTLLYSFIVVDSSFKFIK
jgi:hypothetical protein